MRPRCWWCGEVLPPDWLFWAGPCCNEKKAAAYRHLAEAHPFVNGAEVMNVGLAFTHDEKCPLCAVDGEP